jgi:hypothetical protein
MTNCAFDPQNRCSISSETLPLQEVAAAQLNISWRAARKPVIDRKNTWLSYAPIRQPERGFGSPHRSTSNALFAYTNGDQSESQGMGTIPCTRNSFLANALFWARRLARMTRWAVRILGSPTFMDEASVRTFGGLGRIRRLYLHPVRGG